jgi:hypothetical protein
MPEVAEVLGGIRLYNNGRVGCSFSINNKAVVLAKAWGLRSSEVGF